MLNYKLPTTSGYNSCVQAEISVAHSSTLAGKQSPDSVSRNRKKQTNRAVPALNRIIDTENLSITTEYQLERPAFNGRKSRARPARNKYGINQLRSARATEILLPSYDSTEPDKQLQITTKPAEPEEAPLFGGRPKHRPRTGGLLHSLFSSYNKSYILTDNSREPRDISPVNKDNTTGRQQSYHQTYHLDSVERNEPTVQLQRGALTKFFEHVKLEEAHIPAPSRSKLVYKSSTASDSNELEVTEVANEDANSGEYVSKASLSSGKYGDDYADRDVKQANWLTGKIIAKKGKKNHTIKSVESLDSTSNSITRTNDYVTYKRKHLNSYMRIGCEPDDNDEDSTLTRKPRAGVTYTRHVGTLAEILSETRRERQDPMCNAQSNFLELRNEVSVPDDKADSERQDLSSGRRSISSNSSSDSDTPEQAMDDSIKYTRRRLSGNEYKEHLGINAVSPESMQVLEQFESAMLETGCSNAATC